MLRGIFPAVPTPFSADGTTVILDAIPPLCESLLSDGAHGIFICGTTGEGPSLTAEEKLQVIETAVRTVKGRGRIIAQVGGGDLPGTLTAARRAKALGIDAVSLLQPWFFSCDEEAQFNWIARVANALEGFPLYLYNLPQCTGNPLSAATLERLLNRFEHIRGIKESGSVEALEAWNTFRSERFQVICGMDSEVCRNFRMGNYAVVASTANVQPRVFCALYEAAMNREWEIAERHQKQICRYTEILDSKNLIAMIKESLRFKGIDAGYTRPPLRNLKPDEVENLRRKLREIMEF